MAYDIHPGKAAQSGAPPIDSAARLVVHDADLAVGAHLVTRRRGYTHHGIYAGDDKVVHYAGLCRSLHRAPVQQASVFEFARGHEVWIKPTPRPKYCGEEAVRRAYSRLGEDRYRLTTNNCEHFCEWCLYGESRSEQVEQWLGWPRHVVHAASRLLRQVLGADTALTAWECLPSSAGTPTAAV
ncbi:MAG: lecithin retinol acyltransferase family protein [Cupriavidus necator]